LEPWSPSRPRFREEEKGNEEEDAAAWGPVVSERESGSQLTAEQRKGGGRGAPELGRGAIEKKKKRGREAGPHVLGLRGETGLRVGGWGGAKQKGF